MVFKGYLEVGGREVANSARAFGYATTADCPASWLKDPECAGITDALGDVAYDFANIDQAPWFDPDQADLSKRFLGVYPITVENLSDSTRTAEVTERSNDGGRIGGRRHTSRAVRVQAWLTAQGADAMDYGMGWLAAAVSAGACGQHNSRCGVADLSFFTDCPPGRVDVPDYTAWTPQAVDLFTNPRFEDTSDTVEARRNLASDPAATANRSAGGGVPVWGADWFGSGTTGAISSVTDATDGPLPELATYQRKTWTSTNGGSGNVGWSHASLAGTLGYPVTPGQTLSVSSYLRPSSGGHTARIQYGWFDSSGVGIGPTTYGASLEMPVGEWSRIMATVTAPAGAAFCGFRSDVLYGPWAIGDTLDGTGLLVELSPVVGDYFDGAFSPDSDLTPSWKGTPDASPSVLTGVGVTSANISGPNVANFQSSQWAVEGTHSVRITPKSASTDTFTSLGGDTGGMRLGLVAGETYTMVAVCRLSAPLTGTLNPSSRSIVFFNRVGGTYLRTNSPPVPNEAGEYEARLTFTVDPAATEAFVRLYNGASAGNGDVWWDMATLVEGVYDGPPFTGSSPDDYDQYGKAVAQYSWDGAEDASTSTRETRTRFYRPQSADEYEATVSPFRRFAHDVDATSGPFTVQEHKSSDGVHVGRLVEFTITAEDAFIYAATRQVPVLPSLPTVVQDTLYNLFPTPSMELTGGGSVVVATNYAQNPSVETNATGWASNTVAITPAATGDRSTELAASGAASYKVSVTATNSGTNGQLLAYQDVSLASIPAGSKVSVGMWATLVRASGTAVLGNIAMRVDWLNSSSATISSTSLGTEPAAGGPLAATSLTPPAGAVTARVVAAGNVTSWSAGAVLALYADALSVTVP